jgi:phosphate transport system protein
MAKHLTRDLEVLKKEILAIGVLVEDAITKSIYCLDSRRVELAEEVIAGDREIDLKEVHIEDECLKVLALHQPVAADLRYVVTVLKVNNDLERMGDLATNIAKRAQFLSSQDSLQSDIDLTLLAKLVIGMVRQSIDALVRTDTALARRVMGEDDSVDHLHRQTYERVQALIRADPEKTERAIQLLSVSRHLERIADLATNIAEDVIFLVDGEIIRHSVHQ